MSKVYVRDKRSIFTISRMRILLLLPMIIYGIYKNGIFLYKNKYISEISMFKPLFLLIIGFSIGCLVNIIYQYLIKKSKAGFINEVFSSFHPEYGVCLACIMSVNVDYVVFSLVTFIVFMLSKFLNNRINTVAFCFIIIYFVSLKLSPMNFINYYEADKTLSLSFFDYLIGRGVGGIMCSNIILLILAVILLHITDNIKSTISVTSLITYIVLVIGGSFIIHNDIIDMLFYPSLLFAILFISTDSVTSPYTNKGQSLYAVLISISTYALTYYNPYLAPFIAISFFSLFNSIIDRIVTKNNVK